MANSIPHRAVRRFRVLGCVSSGFLKLVYLPDPLRVPSAISIRDDLWIDEVPVEMVPFDLRLPNSEIQLVVEDRVRVVKVEVLESDVLLSRLRKLELVEESHSMTTIDSIAHSDPDILGGTPVFVGTRVPVQTLFDYLTAGDSLDEFLAHFPTVSRSQAVKALECANELLVTHAHSS